MDEVVYRGTATNATRVQVVTSGSASEPTRVKALPHHVKHSPTGFSWGYAGSGPAELARCLLIDALGDRATCTTCNGVSKVTAIDDGEGMFRPTQPGDDPAHVIGCIDCDFGFGPEVERCYQTFKFEVVAAWPQTEPWQIAREEILAWHAAHWQPVGSTRH